MASDNDNDMVAEIFEDSKKNRNLVMNIKETGKGDQVEIKKDVIKDSPSEEALLACRRGDMEEKLDSELVLDINNANNDSGGWGDEEDWEAETTPPFHPPSASHDTNCGERSDISQHHVHNQQSQKETEFEWDDWDEEPTKPVEEDWGSSPSEGVLLACRRGNLEKLKEFLSTKYTFGINQFFRGTYENPLISACTFGNLDVITYLLEEKKANPNLRHPVAKLFPLIAVAASPQDDEGSLECTKALVKAGADLNMEDRQGATALITAIRQRKQALARYLIKSGANTNSKEAEDDRSALFFAVLNGDGQLCRLLVEHGADVHAVDRFCYTADGLAQDKSLNDVADFLLAVRQTKWKPGYHPNLMKEIDYEALNKGALDYLNVREQSAVEILLSAVDADKYLKNFQTHKVTYVQLLNFDDDLLKEIGIEEEEIRAKILDHINRIQRAGPMVRRDMKTKSGFSAEILCMLVNVEQHLIDIGSTLEHTIRRVEKAPEDLKFDLERNRLDEIMEVCKDAEKNSELAVQGAVSLHNSLGQLLGLTELELPQKINSRVDFTFCKKYLPTMKILFLGATGLGVLFWLKFKRR